jgi:adenylosuccinate synthase
MHPFEVIPHLLLRPYPRARWGARWGTRRGAAAIDDPGDRRGTRRGAAAIHDPGDRRGTRRGAAAIDDPGDRRGTRRGAAASDDPGDRRGTRRGAAAVHDPGDRRGTRRGAAAIDDPGDRRGTRRGAAAIDTPLRSDSSSAAAPLQKDTSMHHIFLTVDLGFGDAGKGSLVDYLTRTYEAHTVVRYNGGAQAGHRVVTGGPSPREHVFAQFGAGTLAGADTHLSRFMILDPLAMLAEEKHLRTIGVSDAFGQTTIDARALVITPFGRAINRLRELARGADRHGSCGIGVGETVADALAHPDLALRAGDLADSNRLYHKLSGLHELNRAKLAALRPDLPTSDQAAIELDLLENPDWAAWLLDAYAEFAARAQVVPGDHLRTILARPGTVVFEGAQGVLLDEWRGFHPHTTWSNTTLQNADTLLTEAGYDGTQTRIGITRAYSTRHGAGPMPSEEAVLSAALPDARNHMHTWQQGFRVGWLDLVLLRYAVEVVGQLDGLAVTCLDRLENLPEIQICQSYQIGPLQVKRIIPSPEMHNLAYQEQITATLNTCRPILTRLSNTDALLNRLSHNLGLPIVLTSHGPTAEDKKDQPSQF